MPPGPVEVIREQHRVAIVTEPVEELLIERRPVEQHDQGGFARGRWLGRGHRGG
jgi:hypothetical protein